MKKGRKFGTPRVNRMRKDELDRRKQEFEEDERE